MIMNPAADALHCEAPRLAEALAHVLATPGKQIRAQIVYASHQLFCEAPTSGVHTAATAIEWLHSYSLVHDDLPAMDDDDMRRGQPTVHKAFDEATAILVGDGLQAAAFAHIAGDTTLTPNQRIELVALLAQAVGFAGMVGGQALDIAGERQCLSLPELERTHNLKTGALITAAAVAGGICGNAGPEDINRLNTFGRHLGLAFQVVDDILDVTQSSEQLGKTAGKDVTSAKSTYITCLGLTGARNEADRLMGEALAALAVYGNAGDALRAIAEKVVHRLS